MDTRTKRLTKTERRTITTARRDSKRFTESVTIKGLNRAKKGR